MFSEQGSVCSPIETDKSEQQGKQNEVTKYLFHSFIHINSLSKDAVLPSSTLDDYNSHKSIHHSRSTKPFPDSKLAILLFTDNGPEKLSLRWAVRRPHRTVSPFFRPPLPRESVLAPALCLPMPFLWSNTAILRFSVNPAVFPPDRAQIPSMFARLYGRRTAPFGFALPARLCDFSITAGLLSGLLPPHLGGAESLFLPGFVKPPIHQKRSSVTAHDCEVGLGREHRLRHRSDTGRAIW
jgi:hypothetical protein